MVTYLIENIKKLTVVDSTKVCPIETDSVDEQIKNNKVRYVILQTIKETMNDKVNLILDCPKFLETMNTLDTSDESTPIPTENNTSDESIPTENNTSDEAVMKRTFEPFEISQTGGSRRRPLVSHSHNRQIQQRSSRFVARQTHRPARNRGLENNVQSYLGVKQTKKMKRKRKPRKTIRRTKKQRRSKC